MLEFCFGFRFIPGFVLRVLRLCLFSVLSLVLWVLVKGFGVRVLVVGFWA